MSTCPNCGHELLECCGGMVYEGERQHRPGCPPAQLLLIDGARLHLVRLVFGQAGAALHCEAGCDLAGATHYRTALFGSVDLEWASAPRCPAVSVLQPTS